jgi:two-component system, NarL family, response regulator NreC
LSSASVLVVDDHPILREGIAQLVNREPDLRTVAEAGSVDEAISALAAQRVDLAIVDLSLQGRSGIELLKSMRSRFPETRTVVVSMHDENLYAERALRAGARGYVMKQEAPRKIVTALREVRAGNLYVSDRLRARLLERLVSDTPTQPTSPLSALTDRSRPEERRHRPHLEAQREHRRSPSGEHQAETWAHVGDGTGAVRVCGARGGDGRRVVFVAGPHPCLPPASAAQVYGQLLRRNFDTRDLLLLLQPAFPPSHILFLPDSRPQPRKIEAQLSVVTDGQQVHGGAHLHLGVQDQIITAAQHPQAIGRAGGQLGELRDRFGGLRRLIQVAPAHTRKSAQVRDHRVSQHRQQRVVGVRCVGFPQEGFDGVQPFQEARRQLDPVRRVRHALRLDYYHRLEHERIHLLLIDDARRGLEDVVAGRTQEADAAIAALQKRRAGARKSPNRAAKRA